MSTNNKPRRPQAVPEKPIPEYKEWLNALTEKQTYLALASLISLLLLVIFFDFIMGDRYYLFKDIGSDSLNLCYPYWAHISQYIRSDGFPKWSFASGMGKAIFPGGFGDPGSMFLYLLGPQKLPYGIALVEILKIFLSCLIFFQFLRLLDQTRAAAIIGSLLYSLSGFMIVGGSWYMFSSEALYLSLLLLAFEKLYRQDSWFLFPVAIALIAGYQPFDVYLYGLFLIFYMLFRLFTSESVTFSKFLPLGLKMAGLTALGLLIASFFIFPSVRAMVDSPRVTGNSSYFNTLMSRPVFEFGDTIHYTTAIMRTFANDMIGNGSNFKGWYNYLEAPIFYVGLLPLLLFGQVFHLVSMKKRIVYALFFAVFFLPVIFPFFRNAFWAFSGDYYRGFSLFFALVILLFSVQVITELDKLKRVNLPILILNLVLLLALLYYPYESIDQMIDRELQLVATTVLIVFSVIVLLFNLMGNRAILKVALILMVCFELVWFNGKTVRERDSVTQSEWNSKTGYNDYTNEALAYIQSNEKGFYRVNKDYSSGLAIHSSINDALAQNFFGTSSYDPFSQKYYIRFLEETAVIKKGDESRTRWAPGLSTRPILQMFGSIKYNLCKKAQSFFQQMGNDSVNKFGDVHVLKNRYFLPLGFTYDRMIPLSQFRKLSVLQRDAMLLKAFVAEEPVAPAFKGLKELSIADASMVPTFDEISLDINARKADTLRITSFSQNHINGDISLKEQKMLFMSIPYDKGWKATIDRQPVEPALCNIGFMGFLLDKGEHHLQLHYEVPQLMLSIWLSVAGIFLFLVILLIRDRKSFLGKLIKE